MMDALITFIVILLIVAFWVGVIIGIFWLFYIGFWYGVIGFIVITTLFLWASAWASDFA